MEAMVKKWYEYLGQGQLMGTRCADCGTYEFPPLPICDNCGGFDMQWTQLSGRGTMISIRTPLRPEPAFEKDWPYSDCIVLLEEGPQYGGMIFEIGPDQFEEYYNKPNQPVEVVFQDRGEYTYVAWRLAEVTLATV